MTDEGLTRARAQAVTDAVARALANEEYELQMGVLCACVAHAVELFCVDEADRMDELGLFVGRLARMVKCGDTAGRK